MGLVPRSGQPRGGDSSWILLRVTGAPVRLACEARPAARGTDARKADTRVQRDPDVAKRERPVSVATESALRPVHATAHASGDPEGTGTRGASRCADDEWGSIPLLQTAG